MLGLIPNFLSRLRKRGADVPSSALHLCEWTSEILGDVNAEELKAVYPLHRCLVDGDGCGVLCSVSEIHHTAPWSCRC